MEERYRTGESLSVIKVRLATTSSWRPAISKPPYFTALALWPWIGSYFGGGFFESSTRLWISAGNGEVKLHPNFEPCPLEVSTAWDELSLRRRSIYQRRLLRRGWRCIQAVNEPTPLRSTHPKAVMRAFREAPAFVNQPWEIWEWQSPKGEIIRMLSYFSPDGGTEDILFYRRLPNGEEQLIDYPVIDWDQRGRMVRVEGSKVFVAEFQEGQLVEQALIDLNAAEPARLEAPPWAKRWT